MNVPLNQPEPFKRAERRIELITPTEAKDRLVNFKDKNFRLHQEEAISWIMNGTKKFRIIRAKTGFGKSLCAMVCGLMAGDLTYLVSSKFLQGQITKDFPRIIESLWGRNNYPCLLDNSRNCNECFSTKLNPCEKKSLCLYKIAKTKALESSYRITNFAYFLSEISYAGRFSGNPFTVIDEADSLQKSLDAFVSLSFGERSLFQLGLQEGPKYKTASAKNGIDSWKNFVQEALVRSNQILGRLQREINAIDNQETDFKLKKIKEMENFVHLSERCEIFLNNVDKGWVMQEIPRYGARQGRLIFSPTWINPELANKFLWNHSGTFVLISATFLPIAVECKRLGIDIDDVEDGEIHEVESTFNPDNAPVHIWPAANLTRDTMADGIPKLASAVKWILNKHKNQRGLIHTVSFDLCNKVMAAVDSSRLITHTSENRQEIINDYVDGFDKNDPGDVVLCSPSSERGLDLKYEMCSFIVILKMPWLSLADKIISARANSGTVGRLWYQAEAMATIEQMAGRGNRVEDDTVTIYILDEQVNKIYTSRPSLWSKSFQAQVAWDEAPWGYGGESKQ